jgi:sugar lactone lactonase YvrE
VTVLETAVLAEGLVFPEAPRWHGGRLWFSDMYDQKVKTVDLDGQVEEVLSLGDRPSGLGWRPDGTLLVVSMEDRRLLGVNLDAGGAATAATEVVADLSGVAPGPCNDMVVDGDGRAYIGGFGPEGPGDVARLPTGLVVVEPDGRVHQAAGDLAFPNGIVLIDGGRTMVVAETHAHRLTTFVVGEDGSLGERSVFAEVGEARPDGICADLEGAIWVATTQHEVLRVRPGGTVTHRVTTGEHRSFACMLGGPSGTTLFVCTAKPTGGDLGADRSGRIETVEVEVPAAGLP